MKRILLAFALLLGTFGYNSGTASAALCQRQIYVGPNYAVGRCAPGTGPARIQAYVICQIWYNPSAAYGRYGNIVTSPDAVSFVPCYRYQDKALGGGVVYA